MQPIGSESIPIHFHCISSHCSQKNLNLEPTQPALNHIIKYDLKPKSI